MKQPKELVVTVSVNFQCEMCKKEEVKYVVLGPEFKMNYDQFPPGWTGAVEYDRMFVWCPICTLKRTASSIGSSRDSF